MATISKLKLIIALISLLVTSVLVGQPLPSDVSVVVPDGLESSVRNVLNNYLINIASSELKSIVNIERGETANLRGMENKTVSILHIDLSSSYNGKEIKAQHIELKGAGSQMRQAELKALRQLPRNAFFKRWIEEVNAAIPSTSDTSCKAISLLEGVNLPDDGKEAATLVRYVSSFRQNKGCDEQAKNVLGNLSNQYADRQCSTLDALELEIAAATYNRSATVQQLKRIRPEGPCWSRALRLASKIGEDARASLATHTDNNWIQWFVREKMLH